jgi:shikimate kinase
MLANTLKYAFFDTDTMVEMTHEKRPVSDIFKEYGEEYFRECEAEVLKQLAPYKNLVVATGGGAVIRSLNWSYLHSGKFKRDQLGGKGTHLCAFAGCTASFLAPHNQ